MGSEGETVCVTGAAGFIGSWLIMRLLERGYTVRATVRDPENLKKVKHLIDLPKASTHLTLWKADLNEEGSFDEAIKGCTGVFHVATPMDFESKDPENEVIKPTINGVLSIMKACVNAKTVRRLVFTSSAGTVNVEEHIKPVYDENCWTDVEFVRKKKMTGWMYFVSKTLAEQAAWKFAKENNLDFISIIPPLVVGPFIMSSMPPSLITGLSPITGNEAHYSIIKQGQFVHLDDLVNSHIYLYENPKAEGRYICSRSFATKKRKLNERQGIQIHMNDLPSNRQDFKDEQISMEETSGRQCGKEKKARALKLQGNETNTRKASSEPEKQGTVTRILFSSSKNNPLDRTGSYEGRKSSKKDQHFGQYDGYNLSQWTVDGNNSFRRDFGARHPGIAATSSSSMISGTGKIKVNFNEFKGSPAESVCSSPLRISNPEYHTRSLSGKDVSADVGLALINSPGTYLVGEDDGRSQHYESIRKEKAFTVIQDGSSVSPSFDYQGRFTEHKIHGKAKSSTVHTSNIRNSHLLNVCTENDKHTNEPSKNHHFHDMARVNSHCSPKKCLPEKSTNVCSLQAKERHSTPISDLDKSNIRISESFNEQEESDNVHYEVENGSQDIAPYKKDIKVRKIKIQGNKSTKIEKNHAGKKVSVGKCLSDRSKRESQTLCDRVEDPHSKIITVFRKGGESTASRQNLLQNHNDEKYLKWLPSERNFQEEEATENSDDFDVLPFDDFNGGDSVKASQQLGKDDCQNKLHHVSSRHPTCNRDGNRDIVAPSHRRKDASTRAANKTLKEAEDLKHSADQLKISGSELESIEARFQAALKFLHGASLLDPCNSKSAKYGEMTSTAAYSSTAKLFEYCACEYERCKDMASATLAYKCLEVTFMRMIYVNHFIASSDQNELQKTLQMVSPVQSPSSSASDVDNLYNQAMMDKMDIAKDGSSLQVTGNHVIAARNHPKLVRLLDFAQDVNFAMEASRKSQISFAAANVVLAKTRNGEVISSIKRTLDFSFHDVEELLRLVHLAMEALSSS